MQAFEAAHSVRAYGYALVEEERPGRFDPEAAKRPASPKGPPSPRCSAGRRSRERRAGAPDQVMGELAAGPHRRVTGDTAPCHATVAAAADAELLIHDASFAEEEVQRAAETGHSTVGQAAAVAARPT